MAVRQLNVNKLDYQCTMRKAMQTKNERKCCKNSKQDINRFFGFSEKLPCHALKQREITQNEDENITEILTQQF